MKTKQTAEHLDSVPVRKKAKRILALTLAVLMVNPVTGYGISAYAQELETITDFAKLPSEIDSQQLAVGAEGSDIQLPDTLNVTVGVSSADTAESIVKDSQAEEIPTEEVKPDESTTEEPAADESPVDDSTVSGNDAEELQDEANDTEDNTATDSQTTVVLDSGELPLAASTTGSAITADSDDADTEQTETQKITTEDRTLTGITWQINAERSGSDTFDSESAGVVFFYEPILPEGYTLADGVILPQIQVQIEDGDKLAFNQSTTIDGVEITVKAEKDVFLEGAILHAEKVTNTEDKAKIEDAVSKEVNAEDAAKTVTQVVSFDITITDADGNELQPDTSKGEVKVSFAKLSMTENEIIKEDHDIQVFHMNDTLSNAKELESIVDDKGVIEAVAEHFSVYAITETIDTPDTDTMTTLYINKGNITIGDGTVSGFDATGTEVTIANSNGYIITRTDMYSTVHKYTITVSSGTHNIVLKDVIFYLDTDITASPFSIARGAKVNLVLEGTNNLQTRCNLTPAGIHVPEGAELVIAKGSTGSISAFGGPGAGIGGNVNETGGTITINGGTLTYVSGGTSGAGIGGGRGGAGGNITINGGTLTDVRSSTGAGIGGGAEGGAGGSITINGGTINTQSTMDGAGIGGGENGAGGNITINGGTVTATGNYGAGIGGGAYGFKHTGGTITISGGTVTATTKNSDGVGIGNGFRGGDNGGTLSSGGNSVYVNANRVNADISSFNGVIDNDGNTTVYGTYTLTGNMTIAAEKTMTILSGSSLIVPSDKTLTVNGTLTNNGTLSLGAESCLTGTDDTLSGEGTFQTIGDPTGDMILVPTNLSYNGTDLAETVKSAISIDTEKVGTGMILNHEFQVTTKSAEGWVLSINPAVVKEAGAYTATFSKDSKTIHKEFTVNQSGTTFDGGITVDKTDKTYTYGDTITVTAKPKTTGTAPITKGLRTMRSFSAPTANQMALFVGETQISDSVDGDSNGVYTMTYDTTDKALAIGSNTITAKYVESANMADYSGTVTVTLNKKPLTATRSGGWTTYDGTKSPLPGFNKTNGLIGVLGSDDVDALVSGTLPDANVGKDKVFTATAVTLRGADAGYYSLTAKDVHMTMDVEPILIAPIPQNSTRNAVVGVGTFSEPTFPCSIVNENITGTFEYDYNGKTNYADVVSEIAKLPKGATAEVKFRFTTNGNYEGLIPGTLSITVISLEFAGKDKALALKASPIYGDTWSQIVSFDKSKLSATLDGKAMAGTYTLKIDNALFDGTEIPKSGRHSYKLTFTTTDNSFTDVEVMSGNVEVAQREGVLSWGNTVFIYNGSAQKPTVSITNQVVGDDLVCSVANSQAQTNVGTGYTATAVLSGNSAPNYKLPSVNTTIFSITAATATGSVAVFSTDANSNKKLDVGDMVMADLSAVTPAGGTASYQWKKTAGGSTGNIGTDQATYTLNSSDSKGKIFCEVTFTGNTTGMISSNKLDIAKEILTGNIAITGENTVGSALTVSPPTNAGIANSDYEIQWYRDNATITGANAPSYTIAKEDLGETLKVVITAKEESEGFTGTLTSNVFTVPAMAPEKAVVSASAGKSYVMLNWTKPYANGSEIRGYSLTVNQGETPIVGSPFAIGADATIYKVQNLIKGREYTFILSVINGEGNTPSDTVIAKIKKPSNDNSSDGVGNSSSGKSSTTITTTPENKPNQPVTAATPIAATAGANGLASASISDKAITDAIAQAQSDAKTQDKTVNGISVELNVSKPKGTDSLAVALTRSSLDSLVSAGVSSLEINGSLVKVSFDKKALTEIQKQSTGNINIAIAPKTNLSQTAKKIIGTRPVYDITVGHGSGKRVSSLGEGIATVSIPYTLGKNEAVDGLYAVYVDTNGDATRIPCSAYDANSGCVIFTTTHFSQYGIGYTAPTAKFKDISSHWAKESIDYVVGRGLLSGTSETAFSPNSVMTRGMLVTALGRLAGVDTKAYTGNSFTDMKTDSTYRPYIEWAYSKGIIQGIGNSQFAPDRAITREEIAVIFSSYAKATGYTLPIIRKATTYEDDSSIGNDYKDVVKAMQQAGIMMGGSDNKFNSKGNATRAEVSSMLHRYIKLTINPSTAQGWMLNDAGQYLYYKDSKALSGTQTIDGVKYFFKTDGTLKTGWVKDDDNWRFYSGKMMLVGFWDLGTNGSNNTYYFSKSGMMVTGKWLEIDGKWYYFYTDGSLARNTKIHGYEVDEKGVRKAM